MSQTDRLYGLVSGAAIKIPCITATTANITLSAAQTIDGVAVVTGDRVLVKNQTDATENGIYAVDSGDWERAKDFDGNNDVVKGTLVYVTDGATTVGYWRVTTEDPITIDTDDIDWEQALVNDSSDQTFTQAGTGAVARSVQSKLRDVVSVEDFGAVGNNVADDTAAIQAALDSSVSDLRVYCKPTATYKCTSGIVVKGGWKQLDLQGALLSFSSVASINCVSVTVVGAFDPAHEEYGNGVCNGRIDASGVGGTTSTGVKVSGKAHLHHNHDLHITNVAGTGYLVQGGSSGGSFNSPDKGRHDNITCRGCTEGFSFDATAVDAAQMSGHSLSHLYAPTTTNYAFYFRNCGSFSGSGLASEGGGTRGIVIDDNYVSGVTVGGGGNVFVGGFFEGHTQEVEYLKANPNNSSIVLFKGSNGVSTYANWAELPAQTMDNGGGVVVKESTIPILDFNTTTPRLLTLNPGGTVVTVMGRGGAFARFLCASTAYSLATGYVEILEEGTVGTYSITKGTATSLNVYIGTEGGVLGFYLENNSGTGFGAGVIGGISMLKMR